MADDPNPFKASFDKPAQPPWSGMDPMIGGDPKAIAIPERERRLRAVLPADTFQVTDLEGLANLPPAEWQIKGLLPKESTTLMYAPPASFKSFVAVDMGLSTAYCRPWQGRPTAGGLVVYIAREGRAGLAARVEAWRRHNKLWGDEHATAPFVLLSVRFNLLDPKDIDRLIRTCEALALKRGVPLAMVIIDTVARAIVGGDENSARDMGIAVEAADTIGLALNTTVLCVHHSGKNVEAGSRGSTALPAAADVEITLTRGKDDEDTPTNEVILKVRKQKDAPEGPPIVLEASPVRVKDGADGEERFSLVLTARDGGEAKAAPPPRKSNLNKGEELALRILHDTLVEAGEAGVAGVPAGLRAVSVEQWRERFYFRSQAGENLETKRKAFSRARESLEVKRKIGTREPWVWSTYPPDGVNLQPKRE